LKIDYKKIPKPVSTWWNSLCKTISAITDMAPAFTKLLESGDITGDFQDKLQGEATLTSLKQLLKPLEWIRKQSEDLEADKELKRV
jgi:hypothetical protein